MEIRILISFSTLLIFLWETSSAIRPMFSNLSYHFILYKISYIILNYCSTSKITNATFLVMNNQGTISVPTIQKSVTFWFRNVMFGELRLIFLLQLKEELQWIWYVNIESIL
jgi:hypothetical protein